MVMNKDKGQLMFICFFFKQKTAYEISSRDWSSDVCSSDLWGMLFTERSQPMRTCDLAWPFSRQTFGIAYGRSRNPRLSSILLPYPGSSFTNVDQMVGNTERCSQAVTFPSLSP